MTTIRKVLRLAAPAALALVIGAPSALAFSFISEFKCDLPSSAAEDLAGAVEVSNAFFTGGVLDEKECEKLCKDLEQTCNKNASSREKCIKDDDKFFFAAQRDLCKIFNEEKDAQKACEDDVKADEKECKDDLKLERDAAKGNCDEAFGKDSSCVSACLDGSFPFDIDL